MPETLAAERLLAEIARRMPESCSEESGSYRISVDVVERLKAGAQVYNDEFDRVFPLSYRIMSSIQWSPIVVARTVADFLRPRGRLRFLDVGSGVGKLCSILGMLSDLEVTGIEQRKHLVKVAKRVAKENSLDVRFLHGNMMDVEWDKFDVFYFYNPFQEHRYRADYARIDDDVEYDLKMFHQYVAEARKQFVRLAPGKIVITYHGFGGDMPRCMRPLKSCLVEEGGILAFFERVAI